MAQLKDSLITGSLRVTDTIFSNSFNLASLTASQAVVTDATKNLISRAITNTTSASAITASTNLITANTLAYWNGAYSGTSSRLTTLGTISTGVWQGTSVKVGYGGTGTTTAPKQGGIIFGSSTSAYGCTNAGTSGQLLQSAGTGTPTWITATNENTASTIIKRNANGDFNAGTINIDGSLLPTSTSSYLGGSNKPWIALFLKNAINYYHGSYVKGTIPDTTADSWIGYQYSYDHGGNEQVNRLFVQESRISTTGVLTHFLRAYSYKNNSTDNVYLALQITNDTSPAYSIVTNGTICLNSISDGISMSPNANTGYYKVLQNFKDNNIGLNACNGGSLYLGYYNTDAVYIQKSTNASNNTLGHGICMWDDSEGGNIRVYSGNCDTNGSYYWEIDAYDGHLRFYNIDSAGTFKGLVQMTKDNVTVTNARWNDYAECRNTETIEAGRIVTESNDGIMKKAAKRLLPGCRVISDTYGHLIGKSKNASTPIAVSGRVLAYPYQDRSKYELGAAVCSAPNGTIDIMTREEIMQYPERIIGTVSEIPDYEDWYSSDVIDEESVPIKVNGRIWIYVK